MMGLLAQAGIVVNDSLVAVDWINRRRWKRMSRDPQRGGCMLACDPADVADQFRRLMHLILEKSTEAEFFMPMAVSLVFGILFATFITLILVPACYLLEWIWCNGSSTQQTPLVEAPEALRAPTLGHRGRFMVLVS